MAKKSKKAATPVKPLPDVPAELREAAIGFKRRISQQFMLLEPSALKDRIYGETFVVTRKIDGVMACAFYRNGTVTLVGSGGRNLSAAPCGEVLAAALQKAGVRSATVACELYAPVSKGRPRVSDVLAALADEKLIGNLRLAPFDLLELDGETWSPVGYQETYSRLAKLFTAEAVRPVEMRTAKSKDDVEAVYSEWVDGEGSEGIVVRSEAPVIWKVKPRHSIDVSIIGYTVGDEGVRDMLFAVRSERGNYRILGSVGSGLTLELRQELLERLKKLDVASSLIQTDSRGVAFKMVKPTLVVELSIGEFVSEDSSGRPKYNVLAVFDKKSGWTSLGRSTGVSAFRIVFERIRDDKATDAVSVRESQVTDICPFVEQKTSIGALPKSSLLVRKVFKKESSGKLMVQKFLVWKTNKEADPRYPAFVYHYTDFSSGRKDPLKRDIRVSSDKAQIMSFLEADLAANIKKGWIEA